MTTLALARPYQPFTRAVNTGSSPESRKIQKKIEEMANHLRSMAEWQSAFSQLERLVAEAIEPNWDAYQAKPLTAQAYDIALRFLSALPASLPSPDVGLDPDGEVSFEWMKGKGRVFTVSLEQNGRASYAGLFGEGVTAHGTEVFDDTIPATIIQGIERLGFRI